MATLIVADTHGDVARLVGAAQRFGDAVDVLLLAADADTGLAQRAAFEGVRQVLVARDARLAQWLAEPLAAFVAQLVRQEGHERVIGDSGMAQRDALGRLAGVLECPVLTDIVAVEDSHVVRRPMYAGTIEARVRIEAAPVVLMMRAAAFGPAAASGEVPLCTELVVPADVPSPVDVLEEVHADMQEVADLTRARVVLGMGRGVADAESRALLLELAQRLGAAVAASRPLVDEGLAPGEWQVGQTGKRIAPDLYIAFGISGAHQHLAGIADAGIIVAVNHDPEAPILAAADYGLVMDAREVLEQLLARVPAAE